MEGHGPNESSLLVAPLLPMIAAQAAEADATRSVSPAVIAALKGNDIMRMSAVRAIGGLESSITAMGRELEAVAGACGSTEKRSSSTAWPRSVPAGATPTMWA